NVAPHTRIAVAAAPTNQRFRVRRWALTNSWSSSSTLDTLGDKEAGGRPPSLDASTGTLVKAARSGGWLSDAGTASGTEGTSTPSPWARVSSGASEFGTVSRVAAAAGSNGRCTATGLDGGAPAAALEGRSTSGAARGPVRDGTELARGGLRTGARTGFDP